MDKSQDYVYCIELSNHTRDSELHIHSPNVQADPTPTGLQKRVSISKCENVMR